jgi:hypothetical protein
MEVAIQHLEALFVKTESELDSAGRKLDVEFGSNYDGKGFEMVSSFF